MIKRLVIYAISKNPVQNLYLPPKNMNAELFHALYNSQNEKQVNKFIDKHKDIFSQENWYPYGGD